MVCGPTDEHQYEDGEIPKQHAEAKKPYFASEAVNLFSSTPYNVNLEGEVRRYLWLILRCTFSARKRYIRILLEA